MTIRRGDLKYSVFISILLAALLLPLISCGGPSKSPAPVPAPTGAAPKADYGDAPDGGQTGYPQPFVQAGRFPARFASNGARTLRVDEAMLGPSASLEVDATDPADPDGRPNLTNSDSDDAQVKLDLVLTSIPPPAQLQVQVAGGKGGSFYLNVLIDMNMDGQWGGTVSGVPEWAVKNYAVSVQPNQPLTMVAISKAFPFGNGNILPDGAWMRIALTKESITTGDWDGTGQFSSGEIEDMKVRLPNVGGKPIPALTVDTHSPYHFAPGETTKAVNITVYNNRIAPPGAPANTPYTWTLRRIDGGVTINPPLAGGPRPIGWAVAGPPKVAAQDVLPPFTANRGALPSTWEFTAKAVDPDSVMVAGDVMVGYPDTTVRIQFTGETKAWIPGQFLLAMTALRDPARHAEFVRMPGSLVATVSVVGDPTITITGSDAFVTVSGEIKPDGSITASGKGTVAGRPNVSVTFTGKWTEYGGFSGEYTMGAGGELPQGQSITYKLDAKRQ